MNVRAQEGLKKEIENPSLINLFMALVRGAILHNGTCSEAAQQALEFFYAHQEQGNPNILGGENFSAGT